MTYKTKWKLPLLALSLAMLTQGCVYYYPAYKAEDGQYYNDEGEVVDVYEYEPRYSGSNDGVALNFAYVDAAYYPWWSMDYYYLGRHHYRPAYWGSGWSFSFGVNYGYGPYYWPWYADLYGPYYYPYAYYSYWPRWGWPGYYYSYNYWGDPYWHYRHKRYTHYNHHAYDRHYGDRGNRREYGRHDDNYAVSPGRNDERERRRRQIEDNAGPGSVNRASYTDPSSPRAYRESTSRNVSVAPASSSRSRGMQIRNRGDRKISDSHIGPSPIGSPSARRSNSPGVSISPPPSTDNRASAATSRGDTYSTRYRSDRKAPRSVSGPVVRQESPAVTRVAPAPAPSASPPSRQTFSAPRQVRQVAAPSGRPSSPAPGSHAPDSGPGRSSGPSDSGYHGSGPGSGGQRGGNRRR